LTGKIRVKSTSSPIVIGGIETGWEGGEGRVIPEILIEMRWQNCIKVLKKRTCSPLWGYMLLLFLFKILVRDVVSKIEDYLKI
jgi:hypothetical protein